LEGLPMIFGVFVARRDTPLDALAQAHRALLKNLERFEENPGAREQVIAWSMEKSGLAYERLDQYYGEVFNRLNEHHLEGLFRFLTNACNLKDSPQFAPI